MLARMWSRGNLPTLLLGMYTGIATVENSMLLLSCFSRVRLCATPEMEAHQAPPSLGFSRQEHWSRLPFPSPMHKSKREVAQSCPTLNDPMTTAYQAAPSMGFSRQECCSGVPLPSLVENSMEISKKSKNVTNIWSSNSKPRYVSERNTSLKRYMHTYVHSSIIYN